MIQKANAYEKKIIQTRTVRRRPNFTAIEAERRYFHGFLGELAFEALLKESGLKFDHYVKADGNGALSKFLLYKKDGEAKAIVCTASKPTHQMLFVPEEKFLREDCNLYVGCRLNLDSSAAEIWGWMEKVDLYDRGVTRTPSGVLAYAIPLYQLLPIELLIAQVCYQI